MLADHVGCEPALYPSAGEGLTSTELRKQEMIPFLAYEAASGVLYMDLGSTVQGGGSKLEGGQWRAARVVWGLEQVICEETLGLLSFRRRRLWGDPPEVRRSIEEIEPGSSQEGVLRSPWQVATRETLTAYGSG